MKLKNAHNHLNRNTMKSVITALFLTVALSSCEYLPESLKSIIGIKKEVVAPVSKQGIVLLADGTYSGSNTYKVPELNFHFVAQVIDSLYMNGGGIVWVTYIDNSSDDNETLQFEVPMIARCTTKFPTIKETGYVKYPQAKANWVKLHQQEVADSLAKSKDFTEKKDKFLTSVNKLLMKTVYVQSSRNQWSDVNGTVESAGKMLEVALQNRRIDEGYIVGFSDFEHDAKKNSTLAIESRLKVFNIISQPGKSKRSVPESVEMVTEQDVLRSIQF